MKIEQQQPQLSGAYIRSLVKQLTNSRTMSPINNSDSAGTEQFSQNMTKFSETVQPQPPPRHKKQARRRLHTSRPFQQRLLNMAEARKEIVTALKVHRASKKQQTSEQQQQQQTQQEVERLNLSPSLTTDNFSYSNCGVSPANSFPWSIPPELAAEQFNLNLPNQTLGLNLNFQDFNNIETTLYHNNNITSSSASSLSSSSPEEIPPSHEVRHGGAMVDVTESYGLHHAMDDEEMAEIRSIGEQHQMEWSDTVNLMTSAWWFKFLKVDDDDDDEYKPFDQVMEFPSWLNANDGCFQQHLHDYCPQDPTLPCMDYIGEIEGLDGEWLS